MYQTAINKNSKVTLTPTGQDMRANDRYDGSELGDVLVYLSDAGASRIFDMADYLNMSDNQAVSTVNSGIQQGYITVASDNPQAIEPVAPEENDEF